LRLAQLTGKRQLEATLVSLVDLVTLVLNQKVEALQAFAA